MKTPRRLATLLLCTALILFTDAAARPAKYAVLTFDDGPAGAITEGLLEGLRERGLHATFFLCCYRMEQYPQVARQLAKDGHEIGIHGCSHEYFTRLSPEQLQQELDHTAQNIRELCGQEPALVRPPGGLYNEKVREIAESNGLSMVLWSLDPEDWDPRKRGQTADFIAERLRPGDVVLLHDLSAQNVEAALLAADRLTAQGWQFVTVSRLAEITGKELIPGRIYRSFPQKPKDS